MGDDDRTGGLWRPARKKIATGTKPVATVTLGEWAILTSWEHDQHRHHDGQGATVMGEKGGIEDSRENRTNPPQVNNSPTQFIKGMDIISVNRKMLGLT